MIYVTYGIGLAAIFAGTGIAWAGLRYFLGQRHAGDMTSGMQMFQLALIAASARVFIGVQFLILARYRGLGPDDGAALWPSIAAAISLVVSRVYGRFLKRNEAASAQEEHPHSRI